MQATAEIQDLLEKYLADRMTRSELLRFKSLLRDTTNQQLLAGLVEEVLAQQRYKETTDADRNELFHRLIREADLRAAAPVHRVHFLKTSWFRYAAAIVLLVGGGVLVRVFTHQPTDVATTNGNKHLQTDIHPGTNKAVLTLADGTKIVLDNTANGNVAQQGNTKIIKLDAGQLAYSPGGSIPLVKGGRGGLLYNTISTPRGGQYQITLPDGTKVWLNAASSIRFPTAFSGSTRNVEVMGEAYMEVAKNGKQPFTVTTGKATIQVLGTSFNINAYSDEEAEKTTLIDGSVKVVKGSSEAILSPGEQAIINDQGNQLNKAKIVVQTADIDQTLAWKNGLFNFNGADLPTVMRQLERWYDIRVRYEGNMPRVVFKGKMYRAVNFSTVLNFLTDMDVKYRVEGRSLTITGQ